MKNQLTDLKVICALYRAVTDETDYFRLADQPPGIVASGCNVMHSL